MKKFRTGFRFLIFLALGISLGACGQTAAQNPGGEDGKLQVVASTTFIGDVVDEIGGEEMVLTVLLAPGQNPHAYQPPPRDVALVSEADLFFVNGFQLEGFLDDLLAGSDRPESVVEVSQGIEPLMVGGPDPEHGEDDPEHDEEGPDHQGEDGLGRDPHVWFDPNNVMVWTENIASSLGEADLDNAAVYLERAESYREELVELDGWIHSRVDQIPPEDRKLVTDHTSFGYFADQYGFQLIGAVVPAPTTEAETSGQQLAGLIDTIREAGVEVIFVSADTDPALAERIAEDTGVEVVTLYFGSLTAGAPAGTYLEFMRYNVETIVEALQ